MATAAQKKKKVRAPQPAESSTDALKMLSTPADISKKATTEPQLEKAISTLESFEVYLLGAKYSTDTNFSKNLGSLIARLNALQLQAGSVLDKMEAQAKKKDKDGAPIGMTDRQLRVYDKYNEIVSLAAKCAEQLNDAKFAVPVLSPRFATVSEHPARGLQFDIPSGLFTRVSSVKTLVTELPQHVKTALGDDERILAPARDRMSEVVTSYVRYRDSASGAERSRHMKELASSIRGFIKYLESKVPDNPAGQRALYSAVCGAGDCSKQIAALKRGDIATIEWMLTEGNSPLGESIKRADTSMMGQSSFSIPYMLFSPELEFPLGKGSPGYIKGRVLVLGLREVTTTRARDESTHELLPSTTTRKNKFYVSPEVRLGARTKIPPGSEAARLEFGMEGGVGAYNARMYDPYLSKGSYIVGVAAKFSIKDEINVGKTSLKLSLDVGGTHGFGKKGFTELQENAQAILMILQPDKGPALGLLVNADALQVFPKSYKIPLYGITLDAGPVLHMARTGKADLYFLAGVSGKFTRTGETGWRPTPGVLATFNWEGQKTAGGVGGKLYKPEEMPGIPQSEVPPGIAGTLELKFKF